MDTATPDPTGPSEAPAKVFISYARKDLAFVDRLAAGLEAQKIAPTIDRTEIYAFEDWWKRIEALIAAADTVIFVLSPDSVGSPICRKEVEHALALNKRFAPIVCRPIAGELETIPRALADLNFIFFDAPGTFDAALAQLVEALRTDIGWIRQHTEYGLDAATWAKAGRPGGLLLRSPRLEAAERWIATRPPGAPAPAEETQAFILASRRGASRRRNVLTGSLAAGVVLAIGLAGVAFWQRDQAEAQRRNAVTQEGIARQQRDAAEAAKHEAQAQTERAERETARAEKALKENRRELAKRLSEEVTPTLARDGSAAGLALALKATSFDDARDLRDAVSAGALLRSAASVRELWRVSRRSTQLPRPFTFNGPDELLFVSNDVHGTSTQWSLTICKLPTRSVKVDILPPLADDDAYFYIHAVPAWHKVVLNSLHRLTIVDVERALVVSQSVDDEDIHAVAVNEPSSTLVILGSRHLIVMDAQRNTILKRLDLPTQVLDHPTSSFALSPDGHTGYIVDPAAVYRIAMDDGRMTRTALDMPTPQQIPPAGLSIYGKDPSKLLAGSLPSEIIPESGGLMLIDIATGATSALSLNSAHKEGLSVLSRAARYVAVSDDGIKIIDTTEDLTRGVDELSGEAIDTSGVRLPSQARLEECALTDSGALIACTYMSESRETLVASTTAADGFMSAKLASFSIGDNATFIDEGLPFKYDDVAPRDGIAQDAWTFVRDGAVRARLLETPDVTLENLPDQERSTLSKAGFLNPVAALHPAAEDIATIVGECDGSVSAVSKAGLIVWTTSSRYAPGRRPDGDADAEHTSDVCEWRNVGRVRHLLLSRDGNYLLVSRFGLSELEIINPTSGESLAKIEGPGWPSQIALSDRDALAVTWAKEESVETDAIRVTYYQLPGSLADLRAFAEKLLRRFDPGQP